MATVGQVLSSAESGWTRYNDDFGITYTGSWNTYTESNYSGSSLHSSAVKGDSYEFSFYGTAFRIIGTVDTSHSDDVVVVVDDKYYAYSEKGDLCRTCLLFECNSLTEGTHKVKVINTCENAYMSVEAIDIIGAYVSAIVGNCSTVVEDGWKRLDDNDDRFQYHGSWSTSMPSSNQSEYNKTRHYTHTLGDYLTFEAYFTKIRVISFSNTGNSASVYIYIDDTKYEFSTKGSFIKPYLSFEKKDYTFSKHTVKIVNNENSFFSFDALDLDEDGDLAFPLGTQLNTPYSNWQRIDDTNPYIIYSSGFTAYSGTGYTGHYNSSVHTVPAVSDSNKNEFIKFKFYGTKLSIITPIYTNYSENMICEIDGITESWSCYSSTQKFKIVSYEKLFLERKVHEVKLYTTDSNRFGLDAIDIDADGYMVAQVGCKLAAPEDGWQRIDDVNLHEVWEGSSSTPTSESSVTGDYNGTAKYYLNTSNNIVSEKIKFSFFGSKLRIMTIASTKKPTVEQGGVKVFIDGVLVDTYSEYRKDVLRCVMQFEIKNLEKIAHNVVLEAPTLEYNKGISIDCIDIDSDGYIIASVGCQLATPEDGWQRINPRDTKIYYSTEATWTKETNCVYTNNSSGTIKIIFLGTKVRILTTYYTNQTKTIHLKLDDKDYEFSAYRVVSSPISNVILFEARNLSNTTHTISMSKGTDGYMSLNAIDIDADGHLTVSVGCQLTAPESGWQRIDDSYEGISYYQGNWSTPSYSYYSNSTIHCAIQDYTARLKFMFYGTKLRMISASGNTRATDDSIVIDGERSIINSYGASGNTNMYQCIVFEKTGLPLQLHEVEMIAGTNGNTPLLLDAVDIDADGYMIPLQKQQLSNPLPGYRRIHHDSPSISYTKNIWVWQDTTYSDVNVHIGNMIDTGYNFKFFGSKLIILTHMWSNHTTNEEILIDDKQYTASEQLASNPSTTDKAYNLVLLQVELVMGVHTVVVKNKQDGPENYISLANIDIDSDGYMLSTLGSVCDDSELGSDNFFAKNLLCNSNGKWSGVFKGSTLKLIGNLNVLDVANCKLRIDGVEYEVSTVGNIGQDNVLFFEEYGLSNSTHYFEITSNGVDLTGIELQNNESLIPWQSGNDYISKDGLKIVHPAFGCCSAVITDNADALYSKAVKVSSTNKLEFYTNANEIYLLGKAVTSSAGSIVFDDGNEVVSIDVNTDLCTEFGKVLARAEFASAMVRKVTVIGNGVDVLVDSICVKNTFFVFKDSLFAEYKDIYSQDCFTDDIIKFGKDEQVISKNLKLTEAWNGLSNISTKELNSLQIVYSNTSGNSLTGDIIVVGDNGSYGVYADVQVKYSLTGEYYLLRDVFICSTPEKIVLPENAVEAKLCNFVSTNNSYEVASKLGISICEKFYDISSVKEKEPVLTVNKTLTYKDNFEQIVLSLQPSVLCAFLNEDQLLERNLILTNSDVNSGINILTTYDENFNLISKDLILMYDSNASEITVPLNHGVFEKSQNCVTSKSGSLMSSSLDKEAWIIVPLFTSNKNQVNEIVSGRGRHLKAFISVNNGTTWIEDLNLVRDLNSHQRVLYKVFFVEPIESIKFVFEKPTEITLADITVTTCDTGFKFLLQEDGSYKRQIDDGLAFDDLDVDYDLYTAPKNIKIRPLDMGTLIGGQASTIVGAEIINGYTYDYSVIITVVRNGVSAVVDGYSAYLNDFDVRRGQTKVELSFSKDNFSPMYPLRFDLPAGTKKAIYVRVTPQSVSSQQNMFQLRAVASPK